MQTYKKMLHFYEFWWVLHNIKLRHKLSWCHVKEIWWSFFNKVSYEFVLAFFSLKRKKHLSNFLVSQMQMATEWWLLNSLRMWITRILIRKLDDYWMNRHYVLDVLWCQPIKLIQIISTSEFHEYWWNDIDLIFFVPSI